MRSSSPWMCGSTGTGAPVGSEERVDAGLGAADEQLLDLAGAFVERHHAGVPEVLLGRMLVDVPRAAVDLDRVVRGAYGGLGREELRLRGGYAEGLTTVDQVGTAPHQQARGVGVHGHVGDQLL